MPRRKATQATQNRDEDENFEEEGMDLDDGGDDVPAPRKQKGTAKRSGIATAANLSSAELDKRAADLCRLALFTEYRRVILKREDINKKVMGGNSKAFPEVLAKANKRLKNALGYEIVELLPRAEREKTILGGSMEGEEPKKKGAASKQYIVRSTLDTELIQLACAPDEDIRAQEEDDASDPEAPVNGSILAWQTHDQIPAYGILCVILSLVLVNGKTIADASLRSQLKKLRLTSTSPLEVGSANAPKRISLEQYLALLIKQGYLDKVSVGNTAGARTGGKRERGGAARVDGEEGTVDLEWRWGERSHAEISEQGISDLVASFMTEQSRLVGNIPEDDRRKKERLAKVQKQLKKDIAKAAQGPLSTIGEDAPEAAPET